MRKIPLLLLLLGASPLSAETIRGTLTDDGAPVPLAEVTLIDADSSVIVQRVHSNIHGAYQITVGPGSYRLRASKVEYAEATVNDIRIDGADRVVDFSMTPQVFKDSNQVPPASDCGG